MIKIRKPGKMSEKNNRISFHEMEEYGMILQMNPGKMTGNGGAYEKIRFKKYRCLELIRSNMRESRFHLSGIPRQRPNPADADFIAGGREGRCKSKTFVRPFWR